jgi:predicted PurR-regulated permease PerM
LAQGFQIGKGENHPLYLFMQTNQYPFYVKSTVILLGLILLTYILATLQDILAPIAFSVIIAILLNPLVTYFRRLKLNNVLSISLAVFIATVSVTALFYFLSFQIVGLGQNFPLLKAKLLQMLHQLQVWLQQHFGVSMQKQAEMVNNTTTSGETVLSKTVGTALGALGFILLVPVYVFLLLYYKKLILNFLYEIFAEKNILQVTDVLTKTKAAIQSYMVGLLLEALVVAIMNSIALLILGVKYAVLLGVIGAILNMLPYIGGIVGTAIPLLMATVTKDGFSTQIWIIISYAVIQFVDNHFLVPFLVSSKVRINAFFSIVVVLIGGQLWGVSGMFLSIPFVAILKIIFDRMDGMKAWGRLLGDEIPTRHVGQRWLKRNKNKSVAEKIVTETT